MAYYFRIRGHASSDTNAASCLYWQRTANPLTDDYSESTTPANVTNFPVKDFYVQYSTDGSIWSDISGLVGATFNWVTTDEYNILNNSDPHDLLSLVSVTAGSTNSGHIQLQRTLTRNENLDEALLSYVYCEITVDGDTYSVSKSLSLINDRVHLTNMRFITESGKVKLRFKIYDKDGNVSDPSATNPNASLYFQEEESYYVTMYGGLDTDASAGKFSDYTGTAIGTVDPSGSYKTFTVYDLTKLTGFFDDNKWFTTAWTFTPIPGAADITQYTVGKPVDECFYWMIRNGVSVAGTAPSYNYTITAAVTTEAGFSGQVYDTSGVLIATNLDNSRSITSLIWNEYGYLKVVTEWQYRTTAVNWITKLLTEYGDLSNLSAYNNYQYVRPIVVFHNNKTGSDTTVTSSCEFSISNNYYNENYSIVGDDLIHENAFEYNSDGGVPALKATAIYNRTLANPKIVMDGKLDIQIKYQNASPNILFTQTATINFNGWKIKNTDSDDSVVNSLKTIDSATTEIVQSDSGNEIVMFSLGGVFTDYTETTDISKEDVYSILIATDNITNASANIQNTNYSSVKNYIGYKYYQQEDFSTLDSINLTPYNLSNDSLLKDFYSTGNRFYDSISRKFISYYERTTTDVVSDIYANFSFDLLYGSSSCIDVDSNNVWKLLNTVGLDIIFDDDGDSTNVFVPYGSTTTRYYSLLFGNGLTETDHVNGSLVSISNNFSGHFTITEQVNYVPGKNRWLFSFNNITTPSPDTGTSTIIFSYVSGGITYTETIVLNIIFVDSTGWDGLSTDIIGSLPVDLLDETPEEESLFDLTKYVKNSIEYRVNFYKKTNYNDTTTSIEKKRYLRYIDKLWSMYFENFISEDVNHYVLNDVKTVGTAYCPVSKFDPSAHGIDSLNRHLNLHLLSLTKNNIVPYTVVSAGASTTNLVEIIAQDAKIIDKIMLNLLLGNTNYFAKLYFNVTEGNNPNSKNRVVSSVYTRFYNCISPYYSYDNNGNQIFGLTDAQYMNLIFGSQFMIDLAGYCNQTTDFLHNINSSSNQTKLTQMIYDLRSVVQVSKFTDWLENKIEKIAEISDSNDLTLIDVLTAYHDKYSTDEDITWWNRYQHLI